MRPPQQKRYLFSENRCYKDVYFVKFVCDGGGGGFVVVVVVFLNKFMHRYP